MTQYRKDRIFCWCVAALLGFICIYSSCTYLATGLQEKASVYTGDCVDTYFYRKEGGKYRGTISDFVIQMDNGQEYWVSDALCDPGVFNTAKFKEAARDATVTIYYVDNHPMSLGSLAKEAVEVQVGDQVFLSMDDVEYTRRHTKGYFWFAFILCAGICVFPDLWTLWDDRHLIRQRRKKKRVKAQRRAWIEAHPEEKGAPPSARRKKDRR